MNHGSWLFLPDFQRAIPFQIVLQTINRTKSAMYTGDTKKDSGTDVNGVNNDSNAIIYKRK